MGVCDLALPPPQKIALLGRHLSATSYQVLGERGTTSIIVSLALTPPLLEGHAKTILVVALGASMGERMSPIRIAGCVLALVGIGAYTAPRNERHGREE